MTEPGSIGFEPNPGHRSALGRLGRATADFTHSTVPGADLADTVGELDRIIGRLRDYRTLLMSEIVSGDAGVAYRAVKIRSADRSYNTDKILVDIMRRLSASADLSHAVGYLRDADAVRLTWRWTELQQAARDLDLTLNVAKHQIEDGDPSAHVGEVWTSTVKIVALEGSR
jgi:hypothetical protein